MPIWGSWLASGCWF